MMVTEPECMNFISRKSRIYWSPFSSLTLASLCIVANAQSRLSTSP